MYHLILNSEVNQSYAGDKKLLTSVLKESIYCRIFYLITLEDCLNGDCERQCDWSKQHQHLQTKLELYLWVCRATLKKSGADRVKLCSSSQIFFNREILVESKSTFYKVKLMFSSWDFFSTSIQGLKKSCWTMRIVINKIKADDSTESFSAYAKFNGTLWNCSSCLAVLILTVLSNDVTRDRIQFIYKHKDKRWTLNQTA